MMAKKADIRSIHKYTSLIELKLDADSTLKQLNAQIAELTPEVLDYFQRQGINSISSGKRMLYLKREVHTSKNKDVDTEAACKLLEEVGLPEYSGLRVNIQGLSAHVRELEDEGQTLKDIEDVFKGAFRIVEVFKIGSRKK